MFFIKVLFPILLVTICSNTALSDQFASNDLQPRPPLIWNFTGLKDYSVEGPMCVFKTRPLPCGSECFSHLKNESPVVSQDAGEDLVKRFAYDLSNSEKSDAQSEYEERTARIFKDILRKMAEDNRMSGDFDNFLNQR